MNGNPYPVEVLESGSFPIAFLSEPEPIPNPLRVALEHIATNPEMTRDGMRDLARLVLSHVGSSTLTAESRAEVIRSNTRRLALRQPF